MLIEETENPQHTHERELYWVDYYVALLGDEGVYNIKPVKRSAFCDFPPMVQYIEI